LSLFNVKMIHLFLGPMYAGKTTRLMELHALHGGLILDYSESTGQYMVNHNGEQRPCIRLSQLSDIVTLEHSIVYINEAQFFPDLLDFVKKWENKDIYLFGLDGDFQRNPMGQLLQVIPLCDTVEKLKGKCAKCEKPSVFSKRVTQEVQQILLDESAYIPLCRNCYLTYNVFL
jgi:thymidine kinase